MNEIKAHELSDHAKRFAPHTWRTSEGELSACSYCGSMKPGEVVAALNAGATISFADIKYGWQHKVYVLHIPNPKFGGVRLSSLSQTRDINDPMPEEECISGGYAPAALSQEITIRTLDGVEVSRSVVSRLEYKHYEPEPATIRGKFYTEHLKDATAEEKEFIEQHYGCTYTFEDDGGIRWTHLNVENQTQSEEDHEKA